ncbi:MAG: hypothetical protein DRN12_08000 [Thermoplasmata archaeon]|nr:MAG: hypothetical protein DRN12_08000 [Thermoplasmata archaeon]
MRKLIAVILVISILTLGLSGCINEEKPSEQHPPKKTKKDHDEDFLNAIYQVVEFLNASLENASISIANLYHAVRASDSKGGDVFLREITVFYRDFKSNLQDAMFTFGEIGFGNYISEELKQSYVYINDSFSKWLNSCILLEDVFSRPFSAFNLSNISGLIENGTNLLIKGLDDYENFSKEFYSDNVTTFFIYANIENPLYHRSYVQKMILDKMKDLILAQQMLYYKH